MDEQAQQILNQLKDVQLATKQLVNDLERDNYPRGKILRIDVALDNIESAMRLIENAKYSKDSYTQPNSAEAAADYTEPAGRETPRLAALLSDEAGIPGWYESDGTEEI